MSLISLHLSVKNWYSLTICKSPEPLMSCGVGYVCVTLYTSLVEAIFAVRKKSQRCCTAKLCNTKTSTVPSEKCCFSSRIYTCLRVTSSASRDQQAALGVSVADAQEQVQSKVLSLMWACPSCSLPWPTPVPGLNPKPGCGICSAFLTEGIIRSCGGGVGPGRDEKLGPG